MLNYKKNIWVWVKIRYPNNWMVNTQLDIHICGPKMVFHFDPHPYPLQFNSFADVFVTLDHPGPQLSAPRVLRQIWG